MSRAFDEPVFPFQREPLVDHLAHPLVEPRVIKDPRQ